MADMASGAGLRGVSSILAVSSCKGGVGKSTVAVNLAYSLRAAGATVGLFDADVYGPSLPTMVKAASTEGVTKRGTLLSPVEAEGGIKCMSYGFVSKPDPSTGLTSAAVMRGPMVSRVVQQLVTTTDWGDLDVLVVDMPPGTGDILITLGQQVAFSGAVIVTTPQHLSYVDVVKGIETFRSLKIPTLAVVENMAYFTCEHGTQYRLFGDGHAAELAEKYDIPLTVSLPLEPAVSQGGDTAAPVAVAHPDSPAAREFSALAHSVKRALDSSHTPASGTASYVVRWDSARQGLSLRIMDDTGAREALLPAAFVRSRCRCAACVDEVTGKVILRPEDVDPGVQATSVKPKGNYAVAVTWSDGHMTSIYPYESLAGLASELGL